MAALVLPDPATGGVCTADHTLSADSALERGTYAVLDGAEPVWSFTLETPTWPADVPVDLGREEPRPGARGWLERLLGR